jgi:hypothetical protein
LAALLTASPVWAGEAAHEPGTTVEMPFLIAPVSVDGKLFGYAYISGKIIASSPSAAVGIRNKTPFLQDGFIRDVNGAPIGTAADATKVDQPALIARLLADAKRIAGPNNVVSYAITQIQVAPARPNQS